MDAKAKPEIRGDDGSVGGPVRGRRSEEDAMEEDLGALKRALIAADRDLALAAVTRLVDEKTDPTVILESGMAEAMFTLGEMWRRGEGILPEVVAPGGGFQQRNAIREAG